MQFISSFIVLQVGHCEELPEEVAPEYESNDDFLKQTHHALMQVKPWESKSK